MNEDTNNIEIEDTDGHAVKFRPEASKVEEADTEGHMPRIKVPEDQQVDTEGRSR